MMEITDKQQKCIEKIESYLEVKFTGRTKQDASKFISEHLQESKEREKFWRSLNREVNSGWEDEIDDSCFSPWM